MKKGFTLIELVVILGLFSLVMMVGMSFLIGAKANFDRSQETSEMLYQMRIASDLIRDEIRNATEIEIVTIPAIPDNTYDYLYVQNGILIHMSANNPVPRTLNIITDDTQMFTLSQTINGGNAVSYTIEAAMDNDLGSRSHDAPTTVNLNNIKQKLGATGGTYTPVVNQCIRYRKPTP